MILPAFDIGNIETAQASSGCRLLIEVSGQSLNYILFRKENQELLLIRQYRLYTTADKPVHDVLEEIISGDTILQQYSDKATIVYNFPEASLVPASHFDIQLSGPVTRLIYGDTDNGFVFDERIDDGEMYNVYSVPKDIHLLFKLKFAGSRFWHFYTIWMLTSAEQRTSGPSARMVFYHDKFITSFFIDGQLQLIQTFSYHTPEDVAYYLLLIGKQFAIRPGDIHLTISGLIDGQSALYSELLKYFMEVQYEDAPAGLNTNGLLEEFPAHYFSPLLKMSLCVS